MDGVPQLESEHGVGLPALELSTELVGGKTVLVETIVPLDPFEDFEFSSDAPVTGFEDELKWQGR